MVSHLKGYLNTGAQYSIWLVLLTILHNARYGSSVIQIRQFYIAMLYVWISLTLTVNIPLLITTLIVSIYSKIQLNLSIVDKLYFGNIDTVDATLRTESSMVESL